MGEYLKAITELLGRIEHEESSALDRASDAVADVICNDAIVHVFGCGHSHLAALDAFYRAGGLACVSPLLDEDLMLHDGAAKSSRMEKMPGIAAEAFRRAGVDPSKDIRVRCGPVLTGTSREMNTASFDWIKAQLDEWGLPTEG